MPTHSRSSPPLLQVLLCLVLSTFHTGLAANDDSAGPVTIGDAPAWSMQRHCGMGCLQNTYDGGGGLPDNIGCTWNGCYCDNAYRPMVSSFLTSCWSYYCNKPPPSILTRDVSTALSVYDGYCKSVMGAGWSAAAATVAPKDNGGAAITSSGSVAAATGAVPGGPAAATVQNSSPAVASSVNNGANSAGSSGSSSGGGYSTSDKIALGVGIGIGIPTLLVSVWMCWVQVRNRI